MRASQLQMRIAHIVDTQKDTARRAMQDTHCNFGSLAATSENRGSQRDLPSPCRRRRQPSAPHRTRVHLRGQRLRMHVRSHTRGTSHVRSNHRLSGAPAKDARPQPQTL
eukprot:TRINITY_DN44380_c0_g1_i1.p3 TRINITY_DN44380_c0_g1~~TRINITY_DN44380_c0_g1_i1.p3  ORF type:complete len:109 (-),score=5.19 TRINITY_DN44380_c0_g1_i1:1096-1422(-)